jgi:hypothetical protein
MSIKQIQQNKAKSKQKVSRIRPIPEALRKAIERANSLPRKQKVPTVADIVRAQNKISERDLQKAIEDRENGRELLKESQANWLLEAHQIVIQRLPEILQEFIGPVTQDTIDEAFQRLYFLSQTIELVRHIAESNSATDRSPLLYAVPFDMILKTDSKGYITYSLSPSPLLEALEGIEAFRIRECPVCNKIYWAGRKNKPGCSPQCGGIIRTRKWRERWEEKYKQQRIAKAQKEELALSTAKGTSSKIRKKPRPNE